MNAQVSEVGGSRAYFVRFRKRGELRLGRRLRFARTVVFIAALTALAACGDSGREAARRASVSPSSPPERIALGNASAVPAAPAHPPTATLTSGTESQRGQLVHYQWTFGGEERDFTARRPIRWPAALDDTDGDLVFLLHAREQPRIVELRQYTDVPADGIPHGIEPTRYSCSTASTGSASEDQCVMAPTAAGWEIVFRVDAAAGGFLALYAYWFERAPRTQAEGEGGYEAAWVFRR